jgi:hypothetical protein
MNTPIQTGQEDDKRVDKMMADLGKNRRILDKMRENTDKINRRMGEHWT